VSSTASSSSSISYLLFRLPARLFFLTIPRSLLTDVVDASVGSDVDEGIEDEDVVDEEEIAPAPLTPPPTPMLIAK